MKSPLKFPRSAQAFAILLCFSSYSFGEETLSRKQIAQIQTAADHGNPDSQAQLSGLYRFGSGVKQDLSKAFMWAQKAADQGHAQSQHYLGLCYTYEMGTKKDLTEAFKWFKKSAEQGNVAAEYRVGLSYLKGDGIPRSDEKGLPWLMKAANRGDTDAKYTLGAYYHIKADRLAEELDADPDSFDFGDDSLYNTQITAYMWYNLAAAADDSSAKTNLEKLAERMDSEQITEAQKKSSEWKPNNP